MKIWLNSKKTETAAMSISELVEELKLPSRGIAIAVNDCMVPRQQWSDYALSEEMRILIIKAANGG